MMQKTTVLAMSCVLCSLSVTGVAAQHDGPAPVSVDALLAKMTLEEKVGQLGQLFYFGAKPTEQKIRAGEAGSVLFVSDPKVAEANRLQRLAVEESRLHIPLLFGADVIHGFRTAFPVPLAMAASWDTDTVEAAQTTAAAEARAAGVHWAFAPMVDIARDPRWGRMVEGAGEDPYLGAAMAAAQVRGFQGGKKVQPGHIIAGVKHFAGYGAAVGGRDYDEVNLSASELWNVYLPPFKAAVDAGTRNVMSAYMGLNGVPATGNRWLLTDVLRKTWHFDGFVVSDANAVVSLTTHGFAADPQDAAIRALSAGVDMEMSFGKLATAELIAAARSRKVSQGVIDAAARRILQAKMDLGLFTNPYVDETHAEEVLNAPDHRQQARIAAERSAVLLRNEGGLLPLDRTRLHSIAVIGPYADSKRDTLGPWIFNYQLAETKTVAEGVRDNAGPGVSVDVAPGLPRPARKFQSPFVPGDRAPKSTAWTPEEAVAEFSKAESVARAADVVVLVLGEDWDMSGELASVSTLALSGEQQRLLEAIVATGKPVVLVLMNGRPLDISWATEHVPAILETWFPGTAGGAAVANLLFGSSTPGGKLPFTWPRNVGQVPIFYAHATSHEPRNAAKRYWNEDGSPLYPFGYGLSYTTFSYSEPHIERNSIRVGEPLRVSVDVTNTGARLGDEVAQLYIHQRAGRALRPVRELKGFQRVTLAAGETKHLNFTLSAHDLQYWSTADNGWVQDAAGFDLWVGTNSNATAHAQFDVQR
jgi:beta-glucosidase